MGNYMDSSAKIARAIGTEIARATASAIRPIASAILTQLHDNSCDHIQCSAERLSYYVGKPELVQIRK